MKKIDWTVWKPRVAYGAFAALAFLLALRWTFPSEAVKERLMLEAGARGWQIEASTVSPGGFLGIHAEGVSLEDQTGMRIPIDAITASIRILPLLTGRRVLAFDASLFDGRVQGTADLSGDVRRIAFELEGVDLARAIPLRKMTGMELAGLVAGTVDVRVPQAPSERPTGRIDLAVGSAGIASGQVPIPGMAGGLPLPKVALGQVAAAVKLDGGKASIEKLEAKGGDAELATEGLSVVLQPRLEYAPLIGKAKLRLQPSFWQKSQTQGLKGLAEMALANARGGDGTYQFNVFGSLGHPQLRPAAQNAQ
jgi:type II secretion system protein N